jgi:hypothetical protein
MPATDPLPLRGLAAPLAPGMAAEPAAGGQGRLLINTTDRAVVPNTGLRTNITDYFATALPENSAFQVAAAETIGGYVAVFGIFQNDQMFPSPFFSVFSNVTDSTVYLSYWSNLTLVGGQSYDFELARSAGTNWTLRMNGQPFGLNASRATFDFHAAQATWAGGLSFSEVAIYSAALTTPGRLEVPLALAVLRPSGWYLPEEARGYLVTAQAGWGAEGRLQNASLAPGELLTGVSVPAVVNGTDLWTGGPIAVSVGLGLSQTVTRGTTVIEATASVFVATGEPLGGVAVAFSDQANATFAPPSGRTDAQGIVTAFVGTPNVSSNQSDLVGVTVTLFGYFGEAAVGLTITPPTQLFLTATPLLPEVSTGRTLLLSVHAVDATGVPGSGVLLLASVQAGTASVTPFVTTDAEGQAALLFTAPGAPAVVPVAILVVAPGYWGHLALNVTVRAPPPSLLGTIAPYVVGAAVALAAVGLVLLVRARRRRRPPLPIPSLGLPEESAPPDPDPPGATRRPP